MGSGGSKGGGVVDLSAEAEYLSERTGLDREEVLRMHEEYSAKNKMSRKEFVKEFKRTFPKSVSNL